MSTAFEARLKLHGEELEIQGFSLLRLNEELSISE